MFTKPRSWLSGGLWKPKNPHSLEHLKYLYGVLCKNQIVNEQNKSLLVETLRSISEILIWGDQNDSSVFDFFLEKNMLSFFLRFMRQKSGKYICVQLLQTLNILFENISNETSVYYLLSNNHINSIIVHRFDFSDEEVMAYYISFIKTLSLKLNKHTIHFFYNEHTNDFALYTEAIKFFNHSESMVRIAVRTITLNVYKACHFCIFLDERGVPAVEDKSMLRYIRDKTAAPYFSNLVWFIGSHIIELNSCVRNDADHNSRDRLADLVAEHLDHLHYLNDILCLKIDALNDVLTDHLLNRLLLPLYVYSLTKKNKYSVRMEVRPHVSGVVSLFLLSQVFLIISHSPLVRQLADIILNGDLNICIDDDQSANSPVPNGGQRRGFIQPAEPLAQSLENVRGKRTKKKKKRPNYQDTDDPVAEEAKEVSAKESSPARESSAKESSPAKESSKESKSKKKEKAEKESKSEVQQSGDSASQSTSKDESKKESKYSSAETSGQENNKGKENKEGTSQDKPDPGDGEKQADKKVEEEEEEKLEGATAAVTDETKLEAAKEVQVLSEEQLQQQLRDDSASPDLLDIDTQSECSLATTTEQDGEAASLDDFSTASASPFPTEEVLPETSDVQENKETKEVAEASSEAAVIIATSQNSTDEEKLLSAGKMPPDQQEFSLNNRPYLEAIFNALECQEGDYAALFALCLLYAMGHNDGINQELLDTALLPTDKAITKDYYNVALVEKLIRIISMSCETGSRIRLATLEMSILLLKQLVYRRGNSYLQDRHLAAIEGAREESTLLLRNFYKVWEKSEEIFLDMFEDEFREMQSRPLNVEYLMMDANILLPPTGTPLTGIDFNRRLPCGEVERARRAIRVFFLLRDLSLTLRQEPEYQLPLTKQEECVKVADVLDLNNSDLIACTVISKDSKKERRFLVIDVLQLILVEPDTRRLGWGVVKFVGLLQDVEVTGDKDDSRSLHITIHKPSMNVHARPLPLLSARFVFDDHIRCMAAKQRLSKGRLKARQRKMQMIARLLELPSSVVEPMYQPSSFIQSAASLRTGQSAIPGRSHMVRRKSSEKKSGSSRERSGGTMQRQATHPMPIRHPRSVAVKQSTSHGRIRQAAMALPNDGSSDIEEAQEATPSPEAHAIQSLNNNGRPSSAASNNGGATGGLDFQEIQMKDLSQKPKSGISPAKELLNRRSSSPLALRGRSSSQSPSRGRGISCSPSRTREGSKDRARDLARKGIPSKRSGSNPSPHSTRSSSNSRAGDVFGVTSFTAKPRSESDPKKHVVDAEPVSRRRRSSSGSSSGGHLCPKTLTPAAEPMTSLLNTSPPGSTLSVAKDTAIPKLMPPCAQDKIRHLSETSSLDSEASKLDSETDASQPSKTLDPKAIPSIMMESLPFIDTSPSEPKAAPHAAKKEVGKSELAPTDEAEETRTQKSADNEQKESQAESSESNTASLKPASMLPFKMSSSPPQVEVNQITAEPHESAKTEETATEELARLAQAPVNTVNVFDDPHGIELTKNVNSECRDPIKKSDKSMNLPSDM